MADISFSIALFQQINGVSSWLFVVPDQDPQATGLPVLLSVEFTDSL